MLSKAMPPPLVPGAPDEGIGPTRGGAFPDSLKAELHAFAESLLRENCDKISDAFDLFRNKGLPTAQVHTKVCF